MVVVVRTLFKNTVDIYGFENSRYKINADIEI
jgi:hypothetical protein